MFISFSNSGHMQIQYKRFNIKCDLVFLRLYVQSDVYCSSFVERCNAATDFGCIISAFST